jgi:hypothetical protein
MNINAIGAGAIKVTGQRCKGPLQIGRTTAAVHL